MKDWTNSKTLLVAYQIQRAARRYWSEITWTAVSFGAGIYVSTLLQRGI